MDDADSSDSSEPELFPFDPDLHGDAFYYDDPLSYSGMIKAVIEGDIEKIKYLKVKGMSVNITENRGNTPLHIAIILKRLEIFDYLISLPETNLDAKNYHGETPLFVSLKDEPIEYMVKALLDKNVDVNIVNNDYVAPLHKAVKAEAVELVQLLLIKGAHIDIQDWLGNTPLHDAVDDDLDSALEMVSLLLYYGADPNIPTGNGLTSFMQAIILETYQMQQLLLDYVTDFDAVTNEGMSVLFLALEYNSPYIEHIINQGADVNFLNPEREDLNCITIEGITIVPRIFKLIWDRFDYEETWSKENQHLFLYLIEHSSGKEEILEMIYYVLDSGKSVDNYTGEELFLSDVICSWYGFCDQPGYEDDLNKLICALLSAGVASVCFRDLQLVFDRFGYSDLFRILLHLDIDTSVRNKFSMPTDLIFDVKSGQNCDDIFIELIIKLNLSTRGRRQFMRLLVMNIDRLMPLTIHPKFVKVLLHDLQNHDDLQNREFENREFENIDKKFLDYVLLFPQVPKLIDLARKRTRDLICQRYNVKSSKDFYSLLNSFNLPLVYKKHIALEIPLYGQDEKCLKLASELDSFRKQYYTDVSLI